MSGPAVHLYVSQDLQWFEAPADTALSTEVTQGDQDCRRAYRRLDGFWWCWLSHMHQGVTLLSQIRKRLVDLRGEAAVGKAEAMRPALDYFPPVPRFPAPSPTDMELQPCA